MLFGLPLLAGVLVTALDTLLVLWLSRYGIRLIEAVILSLIAIVTGCFLVELVWAKPAWHELAAGLLPRLNNSSLYVAIGILGATVMPHNLYLHSALVQTRRLGRSVAERREACRFNLFDSVLALNGALIVNAAILVLAAAVFFKHGILVTQIEQAQLLLTPLLGTALASSLVRRGAARERPILHAHRDLRGTDRDGRLPQSAAAALAAAPGDAGARHHPGGADHLLLRATAALSSF